MEKWCETIHLAVGPVDGWENRFTSEHDTLGLGPLTMTYEMAAVVLLEQLYRASEIERGVVTTAIDESILMTQQPHLSSQSRQTHSKSCLHLNPCSGQQGLFALVHMQKSQGPIFPQ